MGGVQELGVQGLEGRWEGLRAQEDRRCVSPSVDWGERELISLVSRVSITA